MAANPNAIPTCGVPVGFAVAAAVAGVAVAVGVGHGAADWISAYGVQEQGSVGARYRLEEGLSGDFGRAGLTGQPMFLF